MLAFDGEDDDDGGGGGGGGDKEEEEEEEEEEEGEEGEEEEEEEEKKGRKNSQGTETKREVVRQYKLEKKEETHDLNVEPTSTQPATHS